MSIYIQTKFQNALLIGSVLDGDGPDFRVSVRYISRLIRTSISAGQDQHTSS
jgi:hypothetical protein